MHEMLIGSLRGNIELKCEIPPDIWPVEADIAEFELALVNIAVNARDAMPGGGSITLAARNVSLKKSDGIDRLEGDFVALAMTDTGVGIAPDVLPRIFEAFFRNQIARQSNVPGLGWRFAGHIVLAHGGRIEVTDRPRSGACFSVFPPARASGQVRSKRPTHGPRR